MEIFILSIILIVPIQLELPIMDMQGPASLQALQLLLLAAGNVSFIGIALGWLMYFNINVSSSELSPAGQGSF